MANLGETFDANSVDPKQSNAPIPAGKYRAVITKSEFKNTKSGSGKYLELVIEILEGDHKGRRVWARLNLQNKNATAVSIARAELSAICHATGVMQPNDSAMLHNIPFVIGLKVTQRKDNGEMTNEIAGYEAAGSVTQQVPSTANASTDSAPWEQKPADSTPF